MLSEILTDWSHSSRELLEGRDQVRGNLSLAAQVCGNQNKAFVVNQAC